MSKQTKNFGKRMFRKRRAQKCQAFSWQVKVWVVLRNEMDCGMQYSGFSCLPNLIDLDRIYRCIFSFKIQFVEMSKRKQVQSSLNSFFGGKQDQEINTTPATPTAAPTKITRKFQESWKERYKWLQFDEKENKVFCVVCRESPNGKNTQYSLRIGTNNFQIDSLKAHEASEGHTISSAAKHASERPRQERLLPAALSRLDEETLKKMEFLFNTAYYIISLFKTTIFYTPTVVFIAKNEWLKPRKHI